MLSEVCDEYPDTRHSCKSNPIVAAEAIGFCAELLSDYRFHACADTIRVPDLQTACLWDYCACTHEDRRRCACETMNVYVRQCAHKKVVSLAGWRNNDTCRKCSEMGLRELVEIVKQRFYCSYALQQRESVHAVWAEG